MYKIKINISLPANYIYHMLSVSKVGYDNSYGEKYLSLHNEDDLMIIKNHEIDLTVSGGEHCGKLYGLLVAKPASLDDMFSLEQYFKSIIDLFSNNDPKNTAEKYQDLNNNLLDFGAKSFQELFEILYKAFKDSSDTVTQICSVYLSNIDLYVNHIWKNEQLILNNYKKLLMSELNSKQSLVLDWEYQLGEKLNIDEFEIVLVNSIEDGAQGIDISSTKDVFNINENVKSLIGFISHEIGIYIMFQTIPVSIKQNIQKYWLCIESLATYHNQKVLYEDENLFAKDNIYFKKFDEIYSVDKYQNFLEIIEQAVS